MSGSQRSTARTLASSRYFIIAFPMQLTLGPHSPCVAASRGGRPCSGATRTWHDRSPLCRGTLHKARLIHDIGASAISRHGEASGRAVEVRELEPTEVSTMRENTDLGSKFVVDIP